MGIFNFKRKKEEEKEEDNKRGFVEYERPIDCFFNDKKEMFFKASDFYDFLKEYEYEFLLRGMTAENNDASKLLRMFVENFKGYEENEKVIK